jgi:hypothetical protein
MPERTEDALRFDVLRNAIYHGMRASFLNRMNRWMSLLVILGGAGVISEVGAKFGIWPGVFAITVTIAGTLQLVLDFAGRAHNHSYLQRRYFEILAEIEAEDPHKKLDIRHWEAELHRISAEETAPMRALDSIAYNAASDALGRAHRLRIRIHQSLLRNLYPFNGTVFKYAPQPTG